MFFFFTLFYPQKSIPKIQPPEIGWENTELPPPTRCFHRSPQLSFEDAIKALLLGFPPGDLPQGRSDLYVADDEELRSLIRACHRRLAQMKCSTDANVQQIVGLLTDDEALAILAYTCENPYPVFRWLNAWLVHDRRDPVVKSAVGPFFRLVYVGLEKLPQIPQQAARGVLVGEISCLRNCFDNPPRAGDTLSFWGISSFSVDDTIAGRFAGRDGDDAILYSCGRLRCVTLGKFSMHPTEKEVLPLPPAVFQVYLFFFSLLIFSYSFISYFHFFRFQHALK